MHPILETVTQGADEFVALRRDIHRHPELATRNSAPATWWRNA